MSNAEKYHKVVHFEDALDKTGFGLYSYLVTAVSGLVSISYIFLVYGATFIVPASACEFETTGAQQGLAIATPTIGGIIGTPIWGYLADTRGRRRILLWTLLLSAATNTIGSLSVNWVMLMAVQFVTVLLATGTYSLTMTMAGECVPMEKRNVVVLLVNSVFLVAQGLMALIAIPIIPLSFSHYIPALGIYWNSWRTLLIVYSVPSLLAAAGLKFLQESPKFAFAMGDEVQALRILKEMHRVNKGKAAEFETTGLIKEEEVEVSTMNQFLPLFKKPLLKNTILVSILFMSLYLIVAVLVWLPTIANQFAVLVSTGEVSGLTLCDILDTSLDAPDDPDAVPCSLNVTGLLIVFGTCAFHSVVNTVLSQTVYKIGNRFTALSVTILTGVSGILVNLVPNAIASVLLLSLFTVGVIVIGIYSAISLELFPTHLRAMALALMMSCGYLAGFLFTQLLNYFIVTNCQLGFYLYASFYLASALLLLLLPDDRPGKKNTSSKTNLES